MSIWESKALPEGKVSMRNVEVFHGNQIGGCVTVITSKFKGETHRIMVDYGSSLPGCENEDFHYDWDANPIDAVFFTHYHGDHVGQILDIPKDVPIYMGDTARKVMLNLHEHLSKIPNETDAQPHKETYALLADDSRVKTFNYNGKTYDSIDIHGFHIEPYSVDHSAYDAYMFLIEADEDDHEDDKQVILHTGDFRGHGRRGKAMLSIIDSYILRFGKRKVDTLVIEGTMMSRLSEKVKTEYDMQMEAKEYLKNHRHAFLICSSTNLDSLASFHKAWKQVNDEEGGRRYMYTYNYYYKKQLETFSETAGAFASVYDFDNVEVLNLDKELTSKKSGKSYTQKYLMDRFGFLALIKADESCDKYLEAFIDSDEKPVIIYSMWDGYLNPESKAFQKPWYDFIEKWKANGVEFKQLHTSGHATAKMIEDVINAVNPQEEIVPMHTENAGEFEKLNIGEELKERLRG